MFSVYVLKHSVKGEIYIGVTSDITKRIAEHNQGVQKATKRRAGSWTLVYAESYKSQKDAIEREQKLKQHGNNKRWLRDRIKFSLAES